MFVGLMQVWVHETQAADDVGLFDDLPQHLRAQVAWRQNKDLMGGIHTFRVSHPLPVSLHVAVHLALLVIITQEDCLRDSAGC